MMESAQDGLGHISRVPRVLGPSDRPPGFRQVTASSNDPATPARAPARDRDNSPRQSELGRGAKRRRSAPETLDSGLPVQDPPLHSRRDDEEAQ